MTDMSDRLIQARKLAGYRTAAAAAQAHRLVYPTYAGHENGSRDFPHEAARYAAIYKVSLRWLMTGKGTPRSRDDVHPVVDIFDQIPSEKQVQALEYLEFLRGTRPDQTK